MKPQRFLQGYKCDCFQPDNICNCSHKKISSDVLIQNVTDTAESIIEVMHLCGIKEVKRKALFGVITHYFLHFEEVLHRIDSVPRKRFNREDLMHDLGRKCGMSRRDSQMAFSIIKRVFKAFYYGTGQGGVPSRFRNKLTHSSECLWVHAAQRTAEACACYDGMFYATRKDLECKIKLVYKQLHDRMAERVPCDNDHECLCKKCTKRIKRETLMAQPSTCDFHAKNDPYEDIFLREQEQLGEEHGAENSNAKSSETILKEKTTCCCPPLSMSAKDYMYREAAESAQFDQTQQPFDCRWFPISKEEFEDKGSSMNIKLPEEFPCYTCQPNEEYDSECECACENCTSDIEKNSDM